MKNNSEDKKRKKNYRRKDPWRVRRQYYMFFFSFLLPFTAGEGLPLHNTTTHIRSQQIILATSCPCPPLILLSPLLPCPSPQANQAHPIPSLCPPLPQIPCSLLQRTPVNCVVLLVVLYSILFQK